MAKKSLTGGQVTRLYTSLHGTSSTPTQIEFRIDSDADEATILRYASGSESSATEKDSGANPPSDWMFLETNEIKWDGRMIARMFYDVYCEDDVDIYFAVTGSN